MLEQGEHKVRSPQKKQTVTVRHGDNLVKPKTKLPSGPISRNLRFYAE